MSSITTYCPVCGIGYDSETGQACPRCSIPSYSEAPREGKKWGPGAGLLVWLASVVVLFGFQVVAIIIYFIIKFRETGAMPKTFEIDWLNAALAIASTFPAHLVTLMICWLVVTGRGRRPFWQSLEWGWTLKSHWGDIAKNVGLAVALAAVMMGFAYLLEKFLPHKETDLEKLLKLGTSVRVLVAALAVLTAPLVEEVVYRGVLYLGIERVWGKAAGVALVTILFALVHVPQYWGSYAALTAIVSLSLVLTVLRAATGKLLPCFATHLVYNGVQAVALLAAPDKLPEAAPTKAALVMAWQLIGIG